MDALGAALAQVAGTRAPKSLRQLSSCEAHNVLSQLQQWPDLSSDAVVELLLKRPLLLCQAHPQQPPGALLQQMRQQLPALRGDGLRGIIMGAPRLLLRGPQHVQDVMQLLTGRLQLSAQLASAVVVRHPKLLAQAPQATSLNLGFLVGLGLPPAEVRHMLVTRPDWCTRALADLTAQWQFVQQALKVRPGSRDGCCNTHACLSCCVAVQLAGATASLRSCSVCCVAAVSCRHPWRTWWLSRTC